MSLGFFSLPVETLLMGINQIELSGKTSTDEAKNVTVEPFVKTSERFKGFTGNPK